MLPFCTTACGIPDRFSGDASGDLCVLAHDEVWLPPVAPRPSHPLRTCVPRRERPLGVRLRIGVHTGECERRGDDLAGITVHIGARVAGLARPDEVLVTRTVKDLVSGSGIEFAPRGEHTLKGVDGAWELLAAH